MPLETATYISDLVSTNPVHTDGLSAADSHMRLIKAVLKAQFPNFTAAALTSTQAQLDGAVTSVNTNGIAILADAGAFFKTATGTGFVPVSTTELDVKVNGSIVAKLFSDLSVTLMGALNVTGALAAASAAVSGNVTVGGDLTVTGSVTSAGAAIVPIGGSFQWWTDTLPAGGGTYAWLNGQAISRTTYSALFALLGTTYGAGNGSTTFNLPDLRDRNTVGKATMGGVSDAARIGTYATSTLGGGIGEDAHTLSAGEMPSHTHSGSGTTSGVSNDHTHGYNIPSVINVQNGGGGVGILSQTGSAQTTGGQSADHSHDYSFTTSSAGSGGAHNNVQPGIVCNHVMRIL